MVIAEMSYLGKNEGVDVYTVDAVQGKLTAEGDTEKDAIRNFLTLTAEEVIIIKGKLAHHRR